MAGEQELRQEQTRAREKAQAHAYQHALSQSRKGPQGIPGVPAGVDQRATMQAAQQLMQPDKGMPVGLTPEQQEKIRHTRESQAVGQLAGTAAKAVPVVGKVPGFSAVVRKTTSETARFLLEHKEQVLVVLIILFALTIPLWILPALLFAPILFPIGIFFFLVWFLRK